MALSDDSAVHTLTSPHPIGISTLALLPYFESVTGIDPSSAMIKKAVRDPQDTNLPASLRPATLPKGSAEAARLGCPARGTLGTLRYLQDSAMTLEHYKREICKLPASTTEAIPEEHQVDLIIAAQASHWLTPYSQLLPLLHRILRPKGSVVFVGYSEFFLPDYPSLSPLIATYSNGRPPPHADDAIGEYWERPGRTIVDEGLTAIPLPWESGSGLEGDDAQLASHWDKASAQRRIFSTHGLDAASWDAHWAPQSSLSREEQEASARHSMSKRMTWETFAGYLSTWSSYRSYLDAVPDDAKRFDATGKGRDISQRFLDRVREGMLRERKERLGSDAELPSEFDVRWPLHIYAVKKK